MIEEWRTTIVNGEPWENYQVSNLGRILSLDYRNTGRAELMTPVETINGYYQVLFRQNGEYVQPLIHRLVAETCLPNPYNKPFVNHKIEGDKGKKINIVYINEDGSINKEKTTIEWATYEENNNYATRNERAGKAISKAMTNGKLSKPVLQLSLSGDLIREWPSTQECGRNGFCQRAVWACCNGKQKTHKGFRFMYADDYREKQFKEFGCLSLW